MRLGCLILVLSLLKPTDEDAFFMPSWRASLSAWSCTLLGPTSSSQSNKGVELVQFTSEFDCRYKSTPTNVLLSSKWMGMHDMAHYYGMHVISIGMHDTAHYYAMHHKAPTCDMACHMACHMTWHATPMPYDMAHYYDMIWRMTWWAYAHRLGAWCLQTRAKLVEQERI